MPKLSRAVIREKKEIIENAARELFIGQGFHATSMRDIAKQANVSLGNLYNYYPTKESIFDSIVNGYLTVIDDELRDMFAQIDEPLEPESLRNMGTLVGELVSKHSDYWLLMYIDVLEFQNTHFRKMFDGLTDRFERIFGDRFAEARQRGDLRTGVEPATVFTAAYMQFFNYYLVEKLFGGNQHLNLNDEQSLNCITKIFAYGILSEEKLSEFKRSVNKTITT